MHAVSFVQVALLALATSSWAITVTQPAKGDTWNAAGTNNVAWTQVSTDPTTFAVTLVQGGVFKQTLAENIDGTRGSLTVSASLPTGTNFQVNIVKSSQPQDLNTILAQSPQFNITQGAGSSSASMGTVSMTVSSFTAGSSATGVSGGSTSSASGSVGTDLPNSSSTALNPTATKANAAASLSAPSHGGLLGLLALFGLAVA